jgi:beta-glucosidase
MRSSPLVLLSRIGLVGVTLLTASCLSKPVYHSMSGSGGTGAMTGVGGGSIGMETGEEVVLTGTNDPAPPAKASCQDSPGFKLRYSPGYSDADDQKNLTEARKWRGMMTLSEKADQMRGVDPGSPGNLNWYDIERSYDNTRLGVRGWLYRDGPRGVNLDQAVQPGTIQHGLSTSFPTEVTRAASFDPGLEHQIGQAMGDEMVAAQQGVLLVPCVNILRHPFWGRAQETYGEDSFLIGRIGTGLVAGVQEYVAACVKHFAANNVDAQRQNNNAMLDNQTLREIYGRHFDMIVNDGGVACVMAAYNAVNTVKSTNNPVLLTDMLRTEFGYKGFVISDWWAMPGFQDPYSITPEQQKMNAMGAIAAGLDLEVPWHNNFGTLESIATDAQLDPHVDRILAQKNRFNALLIGSPARIGLKEATTTYDGKNIVGNDAHVTLSETAATKGMVLLKNCPASNKKCTAPAADSILPIKRDGSIHSIAVVGATLEYFFVDQQHPGIINPDEDRPSMGKINFATGIRTGDVGSSRVAFDAAKSIGAFDGINQIANTGATITVTNATTNVADFSAAVAAAQAADLTIVMAGLTAYDEGEDYNSSSDRINLDLDGKDTGRGYNGVQNKMIAAIAALNKPMVVVLEAGSVVNMPWLDSVPAVVMAWYPGMVGGRAIGKVLFGEVNPSGKLPVTWPTGTSQLPDFGVAGGTTTMDYFLGYRRFDQMGMTPLFPFGWGLSYTTFSYDHLYVPCTDVTEDGVVNLSVDISNTGSVSGEETVMAFVSFPTETNPRRSKKELKGFYKVMLDGKGQTTNCKAGPNGTCASSKRIEIPIRVKDLKYYNDTGNPATSGWKIQPGTYTVRVGPNAGNLPLMDTFTVK